MTSDPLKRRLAGALAVGALLIASLTGCIKMEMNLVLDEDRANGSMIVAVDKEVLAFFEDFGEQGDDGSSASDEFLDEMINADLEGLEGATVEEYEDDKYIGSRYIFEGVALSELRGASDEELSIAYDPVAKTYEVTGSFDMSDMSETGGEDELGLPPGMIEQMFQGFDIVISITFPGEVQDHNGELDGTTVTWRPVVGEVNEIYALASSEPASGGSGAAGGGSSSTTVALVVALAVLVVVVAAGLGFWFFRRRRSAAAAAAGAGVTDTAATPPSSGSEG